MQYVAVSDIHGHRSELQQLMNTLQHEVDFHTTKFVFLGDYVDGGPDVRNVVEDLMAYEKQYPHWVFLKGNHEDLMLDALRGNNFIYGDYHLWYGQGGKETARSYYPAGLSKYEKALITPADYIPTDHLDWLEARPLSLETNNFVFVHAGLLPKSTCDETPKMDKLWIRSFFYNSDYDWGKRVIFGHTYFEKPLVKPNLLGIDTMARNKGVLCAAILDDDRPQTQRLISSSEAITEEWATLW